MSKQQAPLFELDPQSIDDITPRTPIERTIAFFQAHLQREGKSEHTVKAFTSDLHLLDEYIPLSTPVGKVTTQILNEFLDWMENHRGIPCSRKTYARRVTTLKVYFKWLTTLHILEIDPAQAILQRSGAAPLQPVLDQEELMEAYAVAANIRRGNEGAKKPDPRPEFLIRLLAGTGIKKSEAMRLTPADFDFSERDNPTLLVRQSAKDVYKERRIPLDPALYRLMNEYFAHYKITDSAFNCTARNLEYILSDVGNAAEIPQKVSFEMLRWTFALHAYQRGVDPDTIREWLGLSKISWHETFKKIRLLAGEDPKSILPEASDL